MRTTESLRPTSISRDFFERPYTACFALKARPLVEISQSAKGFSPGLVGRPKWDDFGLAGYVVYLKLYKFYFSGSERNRLKTVQNKV